MCMILIAYKIQTPVNRLITQRLNIPVDTGAWLQIQKAKQ